MTVRSEVLFIFICLMGMPILRKLGSAFSRTLFYKPPWQIGVLLLVAWGAGIALGFRYLLLWLQVNLLLKILGYCAAAYVSAPDSGYVSESTVSNHAPKRPREMPQLSVLTFVILSVIVAFTVK